MSESIKLNGLDPRAAVTDALYRCLSGIDSGDNELFESACVKDESMIISTSQGSINGWTAILTAFDRVFKLVTTHITSNIRVELKDDADTARLTCSAIAYHYRPEDARKVEDVSYTASTLYDIELVRDTKEDLWKIKTWTITVLWSTGDRTIVHPA